MNIDITFLLHHSSSVLGVSNSFVNEMNESFYVCWSKLVFVFDFSSKYFRLLIRLKFNHCIYYDFIALSLCRSYSEGMYLVSVCIFYGHHCSYCCLQFYWFVCDIVVGAVGMILLLLLLLLFSLCDVIVLPLVYAFPPYMYMVYVILIHAFDSTFGDSYTVRIDLEERTKEFSIKCVLNYHWSHFDIGFTCYVRSNVWMVIFSPLLLLLLLNTTLCLHPLCWTCEKSNYWTAFTLFLLHCSRFLYFLIFICLVFRHSTFGMCIIVFIIILVHQQHYHFIRLIQFGLGFLFRFNSLVFCSFRFFEVVAFL